MSIASPKKLLFLAALVMAFVLAVAPASFAGEDDPGPTQQGETLGANTTGGNNSSSSSSSSHAKKLAKKDTVRAKGGIQTGLGGAATASGPNTLLVLALVAGGFIVLAGAFGITPAYRRSDR